MINSLRFQTNPLINNLSCVHDLLILITDDILTQFPTLEPLEKNIIESKIINATSILGLLGQQYEKFSTLSLLGETGILVGIQVLEILKQSMDINGTDSKRYINDISELIKMIENYDMRKDCKVEKSEDIDFKKQCKNLMSELVSISSDIEKCSLSAFASQNKLLEVFPETSDENKLFRRVLTKEQISEKMGNFVTILKKKRSSECYKFVMAFDIDNQIIPCDILELLDFFTCVECGRCQEEHKPCSFFRGSYNCTTCGCREYDHIPCDKMKGINLSCDNCGLTQYCHDKQNKKNNICCTNYVSDGNKYCQTCKYDIQSHLWNTDIRSFPEKLQEDVKFKFYIISIGLTSTNPMIGKIFMSMFYVPNFIELLEESRRNLL